MATVIDGDWEWDEAKAASNRVKHGVSFSAVRRFDMDGALIAEDDREDYGEERLLAIGRLDDDLHALVFTPRPPRLRVISLRKAEKIERELYHAR